MTDPLANVGNMADLLRDDAPAHEMPEHDVREYPTLDDVPGATLPHERPAPKFARALADVLPLLRQPRDPAHGGVPLPAAWSCLRAVFGGMPRRALEERHADARAVHRASANLDPAELFNVAKTAGAYLPPGVHIITGQTGGGKTALMVNLSRAAVLEQHPVVYASLELDAAELAARMVALEQDLSWGQLALRRALSPDKAAARDAGIATLTDPLRQFVALVPDGDVNFPEMARAIRDTAVRLWHDTGRTRAPLVVFDYLQAAGILTPAGGREAALREHIAAVVMDLRRLSREHLLAYPDWPGCPVVVLSLTARTNVAGERQVQGFGGAPDELRRADLETLKALPKEAGEVEGTAVTAWVLAMGAPSDQSDRQPMTLRLAKNRAGPSGQWVPFDFIGRTGAITEAPERYAPAIKADAAAAELARLKATNQEKKEAAELTSLRKGAPPSPDDEDPQVSAEQLRATLTKRGRTS